MGTWAEAVHGGRVKARVPASCVVPRYCPMKRGDLVVTTDEEKARLARQIRGTNINSTHIPAHYREHYLNQVTVEHRACTTRHGELPYDLINAAGTTRDGPADGAAAAAESAAGPRKSAGGPSESTAGRHESGADRYESTASPCKPVIVNMHGGGFVKGHQEQDTVISAWLAVETGCPVLDLDYALAPEHPYPVGLEQCIDLVGQVLETSEAILVGHSAGANFALGIVIDALAKGGAVPLAVVADYPPVDNETDPGEKPGIVTDVIPLDRMRAFNELYFTESTNRGEVLCSPINAKNEQLSGFPPTLIITAQQDPLMQEGEQMALKLAQAGNEVTMRRFLHARHGFVTYFVGDEWPAAHELIIRFLRGILGRSAE